MTEELAHRIRAKKASRSYATSWLAIIGTMGIAALSFVSLWSGHAEADHVFGLLGKLVTTVFGVAVGGAHLTNFAQEARGRGAEDR